MTSVKLINHSSSTADWNYLLFNTFPHKYSLALPASTWKIRILKN